MRILLVFTVFLAFGSPIAVSGRASAQEDWKTNSDLGSKKFERGWHNGWTGWMEVPVTVQKFHQERGLFDALTTGVARGVGLAFARTGTGIYEAATCPYPIPEKYEPLMMPERVEG